MGNELRIRVRRVYEAAHEREGARFLVDRLWPRGVSRSSLEVDGWLRDVAPSDGLRRWYAHDPERWEEFVHRYFAELDTNPAAWHPLLDAACSREGVTLLYAARDPDRNNAVALRSYLARRSSERPAER